MNSAEDLCPLCGEPLQVEYRPYYVYEETWDYNGDSYEQIGQNVVIDGSIREEYCSNCKHYDAYRYHPPYTSVSML